MEEDTDAALMKAAHQIEQLQKRIAELEQKLDVANKMRAAHAFRTVPAPGKRCIAIVEDSRSVEEMVKRIRAPEGE